MKHFLNRLKRVKIKEIFSLWKLIIAAIAAPFYRYYHRDLWIICEDKNEARDNGYWFFKYLRKEYPEQECIYAISRNSPDIDRISSIGKWVEFGSLKHWIMYLASTKKISSQKAGNPNAAIFYFLEVYGILKDKRIFLGHGVTINNAKWLYYEVTKMNKFICGAYPEFQYVDSTFGYPEGSVYYTGLCRFDGLHNYNTERIILIMPTWREWIADEDWRLEKYEGTKNIPETNYFVTWIDFIKDKRIEKMSKEHNVKFIFFPHRNMQKYMEYFPKSEQYIEIADAKKYDVQELMKTSAMMITDYSSVFFDMLYMKKPVSFYQFDYDIFRSAQYGEGYFNYKENPFGRSFSRKDEIFEDIEYYIKENFKVSKEYLDAHKDYFKLYDTSNCERVYKITQVL